MTVFIDPGLQSWNPMALRAYIAGLIDGEGSIGIKRRLPTARNKMVSPKYSLSVGVAMTDRGPIDLVENFCGALNRVSSRIRRDGYKTIFEFEVENDRAVQLLREVAPYLVGKATQAKTALAFAELRKESRSARTKVVSTGVFRAGRAKGHSYRSMGLSDEFLSRCEVLYQALLKGSPRSGNGRRFRSEA